VRRRALLLAGGLGAAALLLASCGGGDAAPAPPVATPTPLPAGQWTSLWDADALWQQIAESTALVNPILRPTYIPAGLTEVQWLVSEEPLLRFTFVYADARHEKWLSLTAGQVGPATLSSPRSHQEQVVIRSTYATYQLYDEDKPSGNAWLVWQESGRWGAPDDPAVPNLDHVPYYIASRGLSRDDLSKTADSLKPVEE